VPACLLQDFDARIDLNLPLIVRFNEAANNLRPAVELTAIDAAA